MSDHMIVLAGLPAVLLNQMSSGLCVVWMQADRELKLRKLIPWYFVHVPYFSS